VTGRDSEEERGPSVAIRVKRGELQSTVAFSLHCLLLSQLCSLTAPAVKVVSQARRLFLSFSFRSLAEGGCVEPSRQFNQLQLVSPALTRRVSASLSPSDQVVSPFALSARTSQLALSARLFAKAKVVLNQYRRP